MSDSGLWTTDAKVATPTTSSRRKAGEIVVLISVAIKGDRFGLKIAVVEARVNLFIYLFPSEHQHDEMVGHEE